jgi:CHAD domain-containing protein
MLRYALRDALGQRALLPLVNVKVDRLATNLLNKREKAVAGMLADDITVLNGSSTPKRVRAVTVQPIGERREKARAIRIRMIDQGLTPDARPWLDVVLERTGKKPRDYSPRLDLSLTPDQPAWQAAVTIFDQLLRTMERNEIGIRQDIDVEFLHDFRVAVRRTRAGLAQIEGIFPPDATDRFKESFARLGKLTNRLRDLDVHLLRKRDYESMLPASLRAALQPMFDELGQEREAEHGRVAEILAGGEYRQMLSTWREYLDDRAGREGPNARMPIGALARRLIRKRHRRVIRTGRKIGPASPDADLHALRIEMKKLRYLLEFFASLCRPDAVEPLVKRLRQWQDTLGEYNDLSIEGEELRRHLERVDSSTEMAAALGCLIQKLGRRRQAARTELARSFRTLGGKNSIRKYEGLFDH